MYGRSIAALVAFAAAAPAIAQDYQSTIPANAGVAARRNEEFAPVGGRVGSFLLYPSLAVSGTATDNVLARDSGKISDEYLSVRPGINAVGGDADHAASLSAYASRNFHAHLEREDATEYGTKDYFRLGALGGNRLELNLTAERQVQSREDISNVVEARSPVRTNRLRADLAYTQQFNRVSVLVGGTAMDENFLNPTSYAGTTIDLHFRDYYSLAARTEVRYNLVNGFRLVGRGVYTDVNYAVNRLATSNGTVIGIGRDSYQLRGEGGIGASIEDKLYGEILVGYAKSQARERPTVDRNAGGFSFNADVLWNVNPITTIKLSGARTFEQTNSIILRGYRVTGAALQTDFALTPALLLKVLARFDHREPLGPASSRNEYGGEVDLTYYLSRRYSLTGGYRHSGRSANPGQQPFEANYGSVGVAVTL